MSRLNVKYHGRAELVQIAAEYLATAHESGSIPIPIDEIVEIHEKIDVVPVEDLATSGHQAYTSKDRKTIYVDKSIYEHPVQYRFRFTLAHELAHQILHGYVFESATHTTIDGFKEFLASIPAEPLKQIESQAYKLAGLLLVPPQALSKKYSEFATIMADQGLEITELDSGSLLHVARKIGECFQVSANVIHRCAVAEELWAWDDIQGL